MSKYYIIDSTLRQNGKNPVVLFDTIPSLISYLETMCQRQFRMSRVKYMNHVESIGHSADEPTGRAFYDLMEQYFNMGVIRSGNTPIKTNIFEASAFSKTKDVHGN